MIYYSQPQNNTPEQREGDWEFLYNKFNEGVAHFTDGRMDAPSHTKVVGKAGQLELRKEYVRQASKLIYRTLEGGGVDAYQAHEILEAKLHGIPTFALSTGYSGYCGKKPPTNHPRTFRQLNRNTDRRLPPFQTIEETRRANQTERADA